MKQFAPNKTPQTLTEKLINKITVQMSLVKHNSIVWARTKEGAMFGNCFNPFIVYLSKQDERGVPCRIMKQRGLLYLTVELLEKEEEVHFNVDTENIVEVVVNQIIEEIKECE